jgi:integrase
VRIKRAFAGASTGQIHLRSQSRYEAQELKVDVRQLAIELAPLLRPEEKERGEVVTLNEFAPRFIEEYARANRHKPRGVQSKESILRVHLLPMFGDKRLDEISNVEVQQLKAALKNKTVKTVNNVLCVLCKLLRIAVEWGALKEMPCEIRLLTAAEPIMDFYEFDEYERLVAGAEVNGPNALAMVLLGGDAGLRLGEIIGLCCEDVDFIRNQLMVRRSISQGFESLPKSGKPRVVPMTSRLANCLKFIASSSGRLLRREDGEPVSRQVLSTWMERAQGAAKLSITGTHHILRHTFCSHLAMRGVPAVAIKDLAGHSSISTTERYMHLAPSEKERAIRLLEASREHPTRTTVDSLEKGRA